MKKSVEIKTVNEDKHRWWHFFWLSYYSWATDTIHPRVKESTWTCSKCGYERRTVEETKSEL